MKVKCKCGGLGISGTKCQLCSQMVPKPKVEEIEEIFLDEEDSPVVFIADFDLDNYKETEK